MNDNYTININAMWKLNNTIGKRLECVDAERAKKLRQKKQRRDKRKNSFRAAKHRYELCKATGTCDKPRLGCVKASPVVLTTTMPSAITATAKTRHPPRHFPSLLTAANARQRTRWRNTPIIPFRMSVSTATNIPTKG